MSKLMRVQTLTAPPAPIRGKAYRVTDGWVFADDAGQAASSLSYVREWVGSSYINHDDPALFPYIGSVLWFSASDIWMAYGSYFVQWTGSAWAEVVLDPTYGVTVSELVGTSDSDLYLVGPGPSVTDITYYHWDGSTFSGPIDVNYFPTSVSNVFNTASIASGAPLRGGGSALVAVTGAPAVEYAMSGARVQRLWQRDSTHAWAVLQGATSTPVLYNSGGGWAGLSAQPPDPSSHAPVYNAIHGTGDTDIWVVGTEDVNPSAPAYQFLCWHWNGSVWTRHTFGPVAVSGSFAGVQELLDVYAVSPTDVWVGGYTQDGSGGPRYIAVWHYDGTTWTERNPTA